MANNGRWHGLNVQFDLISINQLAVRKLSKQTRPVGGEGANFPFCWRRFVALENAVVAPQMFEPGTINQRVADFKVATICGTTTRKFAGIRAMSAMSGQATRRRHFSASAGHVSQLPNCVGQVFLH